MSELDDFDTRRGGYYEPQPSNELERVLAHLRGGNELDQRDADVLERHITQDKEREADIQRYADAAQWMANHSRTLQSQLTEQTARADALAAEQVRLREATGQRLWELGAEELKRVQTELAELREAVKAAVEVYFGEPYDDPAFWHTMSALKEVIQNQESVKT